MKHWILAATTIMMMAYSADGEAQQWGPPSCCRRPCAKPARPPEPMLAPCPQPACPPPCPKVVCPPERPCPKPFCPPKPCCPPVCYEHGLEMDPRCHCPAYSVPARNFICNGIDIRFS